MRVHPSAIRLKHVTVFLVGVHPSYTGYKVR